MRAALVIALVLAPSIAHASLLDTVYCRLKPRSEACRPPAPLPPVKAAPAPKATAPAPVPKADPIRRMPSGPIAVKAAKPAAKVTKRQSKVTKPQQKVTRTRPAKQVADEGPDLPWPCWMVRLNAAGKTPAELRAEGKRRGIAASRKQCLQAQVCLGRNLLC